MTIPAEEGVIPTVAREGGVIEVTELDFDERQKWLESMPEAEREKALEELPLVVRAKWINEEREHLENAIKDQPVDGADFTGDTGEQVVTPGRETPQDRAPDVGAELIASLVKDKFVAEQRAAAAEATLAKYRAAFGELPS